MLTIEIKIKRGSLTLRPSEDDQVHLESEAPLVPSIASDRVVIDSNGIPGAVHAIVSLPKTTGRLDANLGRGPCRVWGIVAETADLNVGLGDLTVDDVRGRWDLNVGKGDASISRLRGHLDLNVGMGDITLAHIDAIADINDGLGDINAESLKGRFDVNAGKGDITWRDANGGSLEVSAGLGDVRVEGGGGSKLDVNAGMGKVTLTLAAWERADLKTGIGDLTLSGRIGTLTAEAHQRGNIQLTLDADYGARIEASTERGRVISDLDFIPVGHAGPQRGERVVGVYGDGRGQIRLQTRKGDIVVALANSNAAQTMPSNTDQQRMAILQRLAQGDLTVTEAEALLDRLGPE